MEPVMKVDSKDDKVKAKVTKFENAAWLLAGLLFLAIALLASWSLVHGYFLYDYSLIGQKVEVDESVDPLVDFARFTCPMHYKYLQYVREHANDFQQPEISTEAPEVEENSTIVGGEEDRPPENSLPHPAFSSLMSLGGFQGVRGPSRLGQTLASDNQMTANMASQLHIPDRENGGIASIPKSSPAAGINSDQLISALSGKKEALGGGGEEKTAAEGTTDNGLLKTTFTESFAYVFSTKCQLQMQNPLRSNSSTAGPSEKAMYDRVLGRLFKRVGGFHLYADDQSMLASNVTEADIWWTMGQLNRLLFYVSGPFYSIPRDNELKPGMWLHLQQTGAAIPKEYSEDLEELAKELFYNYLPNLNYFTGIVDVGQNDTFVWIPVIEEAANFHIEMAAMKEPKKDETRKFSDVQKASIPQRKKNTFTVAQLRTKFPHINWSAYMQGLGYGNFTKDSPKVYVEMPAFMARMDAFFANKARNGALRKLLNNMVISTATSVLRYKFTDCTEFMTTYLPHVHGYIYIKSFPQPEREVKIYEVQRMLKPLVSEYAAAIEDSDWMTEPSKRKAVQKLKAMDINLGWPYWYGVDETMEYRPSGFAANASIDKFHAAYFAVFAHLGLNMTYNGSQPPEVEFDRNEAQLMEMLIGFVSIFTNTYYEKLWQKSDRHEGTRPNEYNAFYNPQLNSLSVAYAWIDKHFDAERLVETYGKIGMTIAHEIGHGFDPNGMLYGKEGTLENWMDAATAKRYDDIQKCVVERFAQCCPAEAENSRTPCVDGWHSQGEAFADISGLTISYRTFIKRQNVLHGGQIQLAKRKFWVSFGSLWCDLPSVGEAAVAKTMTDAHPPRECRQALTPRAIPQFFRDFGVEPPAAKRCYLWEAKPRRR